MKKNIDKLLIKLLKLIEEPSSGMKYVVDLEASRESFLMEFNSLCEYEENLLKKFILKLNHELEINGLSRLMISPDDIETLSLLPPMEYTLNYLQELEILKLVDFEEIGAGYLGESYLQNLKMRLSLLMSVSILESKNLLYHRKHLGSNYNLIYNASNYVKRLTYIPQDRTQDIFKYIEKEYLLFLKEFWSDNEINLNSSDIELSYLVGNLKTLKL